MNLLTLGELVRAYRSEHQMTMQNFADGCGLSKAYISILERNINPSTGRPPIPSLETIRAIAKTLRVDFNDLLAALDGDQVVSLKSAQDLPANVVPLPEMKKVPLVGQIACGTPILAEQNIEEYIDLPAHINADYALTCKGESMINIGIEDGDIVYIRQQEEVENGQVAAVMVGDDEATLKRFYFEDGIVQLIAENSTIPPKVFVGEAINQVRVIGRAVAYTHIIA